MNRAQLSKVSDFVEKSLQAEGYEGNIYLGEQELGHDTYLTVYTFSSNDYDYQLILDNAAEQVRTRKTEKPKYDWY